MKVAVLFSGGKDSTYAVNYCKEKGWDITLISVKPKSDEAYIWHFPTVELTPLQKEALGIKNHIYVECKEIGPEKEAQCIDPVLKDLDVEAVILGGVGLQKTQIKEVTKIAEKYDKKVIVPHSSLNSEQLLKEELDKGLEIMISECAASGLTKEWLGKVISKENFDEFKKLSEKHGFDLLGEGGSYNTFVVDAPFFKNRIEITEKEKHWHDDSRSGYIVAKAEIAEKLTI